MPRTCPDLRQLHIYGFRKISDTGGKHEFKHPSFVRGADPIQLAAAMRRNKTDGSASAPATPLPPIPSLVEGSPASGASASDARSGLHAHGVPYQQSSWGHQTLPAAELPGTDADAWQQQALRGAPQQARGAANTPASSLLGLAQNYARGQGPPGAGLWGLAAAAAVIGADVPAPSLSAAGEQADTLVSTCGTAEQLGTFEPTCSADVKINRPPEKSVGITHVAASPPSTSAPGKPQSMSSAVTHPSLPIQPEAHQRPAPTIAQPTPSLMGASNGADSPAALMLQAAHALPAGSRQRHGVARKASAAVLPRIYAAPPARLAGTKSTRSSRGGGNTGDILYELKAFGRRQREMIGRVRGIEMHNEQLARDNARLFAELAQLQSLQAGIQAILHTAVSEGIDAMHVLVRRGSGRRAL